MAFWGAFRINPREAVSPEDLDSFLHGRAQHVEIPVTLVRRLSPDSLSVMEFKSDLDVQIAEKMLRYPLLGEQLHDSWNVRFCREFDMTNDSGLFHGSSGKGRLPLYEGKMIWQFDHSLAEPRYWVAEKDGRSALLGSGKHSGEQPDYQHYRFGFRDVAASTNERSAIAAVVPANVFAGNTLPVHAPNSPKSPSSRELLFFAAIFNSFVFDWMIRKKITNHLNFFYVYQMPVPRLRLVDALFTPTADRVARLTCTTPEFDALAKEVGLGGHEDGATDPTERARLRAELDGLIAHLYGLTEEEFAHVLTTFPLVSQAVKDAALEAYREFAPTAVDAELGALLVQGEGARVEFKSSARWDLKENKKNSDLEKVIVKTVAGFLNSDGGTLLIGVDDDATVIGLQHDYQTVHKKSRDGYELFLHDLLLNNVGKDLTPQLGTTFHSLDGKDLCRVAIQPSPRPVFIKEGQFEHLYIRTGNSTRLLTTKEAIDYCKSRWKAA